MKEHGYLIEGKREPLPCGWPGPVTRVVEYGEDPGFGHYDSCPLSHDFHGHVESDCICAELAGEHEDERSDHD